MIDDELNLARLGHTQQLKRRFNIWSILAFSSCLLGTWEGLSLTLASALQSGGSSSLMYGLLLAWLGTLANAASLAEISSIYPTAGGQYHWTYRLSPPSIRRFTSYIVGWVGCSGLMAAAASGAFITGLQVQGLIVLCHPNFEPRVWVVIIVFWGVLLFAGLVNIFAIQLLPRFNYASCMPVPVFANSCIVAVHVFGFTAIFIALLAVAPKNSAKFVWATFQNSIGWPNDGIAWLLGMLTSCFAMIGYDLAAHLRFVSYDIALIVVRKLRMLPETSLEPWFGQFSSMDSWVSYG
jgi:choline transport protein